MKFIDEVQIEVTGGDGGNGCVAFRREKFRPKGGPSGGDGGHGGSVIIRAAGNLSSLLELRYHPRWKGKKGTNGQGNDRFGRKGENVVILVPVGTIVSDTETRAVLADLDAPDAEVVAASGGRGGRGNLHFKSATRRAPDFAEPGEKGEHRMLHLELKLLADVGVLGFPNVGKSTLIRRVSAARPRVADYPFTTLVPTLGVVRLDDMRVMVMADMPGLIEGAAEGVGLGHRFLKHVERTRVLCHIVSPARLPDSDPVADLQTIDMELERFSTDLAARPQVVVINKVDLPDVREAVDELRERFADRGIENVQVISAATGEGIGELLEAIWGMLSNQSET
jgi:GTP-binding protein